MKKLVNDGCGAPHGGSAPQMRRRAQALDRPAELQVRLDDLVDVGLIDIAVPDAFRVHHRHRARSAAVQAAGLVDAHLAGAGQALGLDALLAVVERRLRAVVGAAGFAIGALVQSKENVTLVVMRGRGAHAPILGADHGPGSGSGSESPPSGRPMRAAR